MKYSVLCPTRNRPQNLMRMVDSLDNTISDPNKIEYIFYVDLDDTVSLDVIRTFPRSWTIHAPRIMFCQMFNELTRWAKNDIFFMTGDDIIMRTKDWDLIVEEEFAKVPDQLLVVSSRDGIQNEKLATHSFIGKAWCETLGYLIPPIFPGDWADNWLTDVSRGIDRLVYKPEIFCEHMHPNVGKGMIDETYLHKFANTVKHRTEQAYHEQAMVTQREQDIQKLKKYIQNHV